MESAVAALDRYAGTDSRETFARDGRRYSRSTNVEGIQNASCAGAVSRGLDSRT